MESHQDKEEIRWQVVKAMLDEFPTLTQKSKTTSKQQKTSKSNFSDQAIAFRQ
jgi:hypothetical protein